MLISKLVKLRQQNLVVLPNEVQKQSTKKTQTLSPDLASELSHQILGSYQTNFTIQQKEWMKQLAQHSVEYLADRRGVKRRKVREDARLNRATTNLVNHIYTILHSYALSYNGQVGWTELYITCTRPSVVAEVVRYNGLREPVETVTHLRARLSSGACCLVMRAQVDKIELFLVPTAKTIGLSKAEKNYSAMLTINGKLESGKVYWTIADKPFSNQILEANMMLLFGKLICFSRE
jgi:hypothetical protein